MNHLILLYPIQQVFQFTIASLHKELKERRRKKEGRRGERGRGEERGRERERRVG